MRDAEEFLTRKLRRRAETQGNACALGFLEDGSEITQSFTMEALDARVDDVANVLVDCIGEGERVLLLFPPGLDFVVAFLACLRAGRIAVPAIPPEPHKPARSLARLRHLVDDARPALVLSTLAVAPFRSILDEAVPMLGRLPWVDVTAVPQSSRRVDDPVDDGVAFLQYTSGSTADPRGVRILRRNLNHNLRVIHGVAPAKPSASVSWLPQFHDMGLIEGILLPLDGGWPVWLMPPWAFLNRPVAWLEAIERFGAMRSGGPNFAFDLCVRKIDREVRAKLDLSCWKQAYCGAEPLRAGTLAAFADAFAPARFTASNWFPCYGLAEHTVLATCRTHQPYLVERLSTTRLARGHAVAAIDNERAIDVVCVGEIPPEITLTIVDPKEQPLPDGQVGEIYLQSGSVADGYWDNEQATQATFRAGLNASTALRGPFEHHLRTGDLGYRRGNQLFIVGRRKDVLIVHGQNHHAHDVERTAEAAHPAIRRGCVCAVTLDFAPDTDAESHPVVVCEIDGAIDDEKRLAVTTAVHRAVMSDHGIAIDVTLVLKHTLPKTSSGKLQRRATAQLVREGAIDVHRTIPTSTVPAPDGHDRLRAACLAICHVSGLVPGEIDMDLPPSQLPLDSLQTVDTLATLERLLGQTVSLQMWADATSLRALVDGNSEPVARWLVDLERPLPHFEVRRRSGNAILVTGGTGLIGRALVASLRHCGRRVVVLARGADKTGGVAGDVSRSHFGLDETTYRSLVDDVDVVMHVAGAVNWVLPYSSLASTNVDGTEHVLAFCAKSGARLVHISSQIVCHGTNDHANLIVDDDEEPRVLWNRLSTLPTGYAQSKAVSEWLVHRARQAGLDATVVRPSLIPAAMDDASPDDIVSILVRTFIEAGAAPDVDWPFSICPCNHLVNVLVSLVDGGPPIVHVSDESRSSREVITWLVLAGYDVQLVSWTDWLAHIEERGLHTRSPLRCLWPFLRSGTLLSYARRQRAVVRIRPEYQLNEPLDPAFVDEQLRAWQKTAWLPKPPRRGAQATTASRALPVAPRHVLVNGREHDVVEAHVEPLLSGGGILSRLATGFCNRPVGVFPAALTLDNGRVLDVVLKASARGDELRALCTTVARVSSPALAKALEEHGHWLDVGAAETRERALYGFARQSLSTFIPHCYSTFAELSHDAPLVLERLRAGNQVESLDAVASPWPLDQVRRVVLALAHMHAACRDRGNDLAVIPWARPMGTTATMLRPLWNALFAYACTKIDADVARVAAPLLDDLGWSAALSKIPQTLLHNDVNPRNLALRSGSTTDIVLYDWELSALGPSTRDLAEWLCYSLSPAVNEAEVFSLARAHANIAVPNLDENTLRSALGASLAWFFFDRLTTYTVVAPIFELPWLGRVFSTWRKLMEWFDPRRRL